MSDETEDVVRRVMTPLIGWPRLDRWLAGVKAQALEEAADRLEALDKPWESPLYESTILWLRASAQQLKEEA